MPTFYREYRPAPPPPRKPVTYLLPEMLRSRVRPLFDIPGTVAASVVAAETLSVALGLPEPIPRELMRDSFQLIYMTAVGLLGLGGVTSILAMDMKNREVENYTTYQLLHMIRMKMPKEFKGAVPDDALKSNFGNIHLYYVQDNEQFPSPRKALHLAAGDLATIAEQCEKNDPKVAGISYFGGETNLQQTDILGRRLSKLGFVEHKGYGMPHLTKWDAWVNGRKKWTAQYEREHGIKIPNGESALLLISRKDLIKKRLLLRALANKLA